MSEELSVNCSQSYVAHEELSITSFIKTQRMKWTSYVLRTEDNRTVNEFYKDPLGGVTLERLCPVKQLKINILIQDPYR